MIRDIADTARDAVLHADVAVVGAGLAGIDVARHLGRGGLRVALVESGRAPFDPGLQDLNRVVFAGKRQRTPDTDAHLSAYLDPRLRGYCRIRQFGGTTNVWTGKWRVFDPWDFEHRPWIPHSGWPIALDDLLPFHGETGRDYGFGDFAAAARGPLVARARRVLAPHDLEPHVFYWEGETTRSAQRFRDELGRMDGVDVLLGATATRIDLDDARRSVTSVRLEDRDGRRCEVRADRFVLATGGMEAPRLLLASDHQVPGGIGNAHDLVGRFFMDHPKYMKAVLRPGPVARRLIDGFETHPRPRFGFSVAFTGAAQRARRLPNHALFVHPVRRLWGRGPVGHFRTKLGFEQRPNPDSRLTLGEERDALGMRRLVVDWRFTQADHDALHELVGSLRDAVAAAGLGTIDVGPEALTLDRMMDASHHMGATRMAARPEDGVVDPHCRVFGTDNLYVAAASVFPTGHGYSPTFTILALARRLGAHLLATATPRPQSLTAAH